MEVLLDRNKILREILDTIKGKEKEYENVRSKYLANLYLGQLSGFETSFYIISSKGGVFDDDTTKTYEEFKKEHERIHQILVEKIATLSY